MSKLIGILTAGGDTPGLNAAIRGIGKAALGEYGFEVVGFKDGFRGMVHNRFMRLDRDVLSNIVSSGGTILGTSRDKPHKMNIGGKILDMTDVIVENYHKNQLEALVCLGGGGTQKNAFRLVEKGLNIITLPKTIDNDVVETDVTIGFDTAMSIATEAIDRLHTTAHSHHRIILVETMGHKVGWLALGAGISGGADVILIPEIPYDIGIVAESVLRRYRTGKSFSIVVVAEGAVSREEALAAEGRQEKPEGGRDGDGAGKTKEELRYMRDRMSENTLLLAEKLEGMTQLESRVTILGHLQRGGAPSSADRLLASSLGTTAAELAARREFGVMVASRAGEAVPVPLENIAGKRKFVPADHPLIESARHLGTCFGDE
ncbi:MAG: 6-phosphofructokinase [Actinobacteria bacterium]|nr:6-phosphofructokinase [Actinomycetota bacterium]